MNVDLGIWDKLNKLVIFLVYIAVLLVVAFWYLPLIQQNERMRIEILRLDTQIQREQAIDRQQKNTLETLRHDPKAFERLARERLGYAKPGETIIRFGPPEATNSAWRP